MVKSCKQRRKSSKYLEIKDHCKCTIRIASHQTKELGSGPAYLDPVQTTLAAPTAFAHLADLETEKSTRFTPHANVLPRFVCHAWFKIAD